MDLHLSGKVAVVTGAGRGIGLAVVRALAAEGVRVVAGARTVTGELERLAGDGAVRPVAVDLSTVDGPGRLVDAAVAEFGRIDVLVNNVGAVSPRPGGFLSVTDEDWIATFTMNLLAHVRTVRAALPHLYAAGTAAVVTIASVNATLPDPLVIDYGAAKAALVNFSKALSKEAGPRGVRVNTISPGPVGTDLWLGAGGVAETIARERGGDPAQIAERAAQDAVTGRFTEPEEVAGLVVYLAGDLAANVTGANLVIDGGLVTTL
ncbi:SDR family oxidoreductase [Dactylosporangium aurantiacum]|uniref:SDR family oxidoreductase n=1 Tax=Dactylosporangium aurantiacum TaxID=35754 RepID=A0A9Q9MLN3_9ACTN|nr:SDR family oxidoreductase [Dactylosporangium aurantiacum]MDG6105556.1 SDR family oxidoreductase [Dactylosporangium aurantiacum]UWZ57101.1 SDR family oxidoreductase [Dactylosporangium aurantiacum]